MNIVVSFKFFSNFFFGDFWNTFHLIFKLLPTFSKLLFFKRTE